MKNSLMKIAMPILALGAATTGLAQGYDEPTETRRRPDTSNIGGGYEHNGMYSQSKKIRPGAGQKKLTRAQRKKLAKNK